MAMMEEVAFPRGGNQREESLDNERDSEKKKQHKRKVPADSDATASSSSIKNDFLFGKNEKKKDDGKSPSKKRKTDDRTVDASSSGSKHSLLPLGGGGVVASTKRHKQHDKNTGPSASSLVIEALGFSKLAKDSKVFACVREVHDNYAIVSLPNLLTAYILPQTKSVGGSPKYPLPNTLHAGQNIAVVVTKITKELVRGGESRRRIQVSALPQAINPRLLLAGEGGKNSLTSTANRLARASVPIRGQISSVEDHGCVIELGYGKRGFLSFEQVNGGRDDGYIILDEGEDEDGPENNEDDDKNDTKKKMRPIILQNGRIYDFLVLPISSSVPSSEGGNNKDQSTTVFPLSLPSPKVMARKNVSSLTTSSSTNNKHQNKTTTVPFSFSSLTPGWLVQVKVEAIANNGLCVSIFGNIFRGSMELNHLGATMIPDSKNAVNTSASDGNNWKRLAGSLFQNHQHFYARILAVDVNTKLLRLSMAPHVLTLKNPVRSKNSMQDELNVGTIISNCTVIKLDPGIGALLALPSQYNDKTTSLLPKSLTKSCELFQNPSFQEACLIRKVYVHISKALDESKEDGTKKDAVIGGKFNKEFALSTQHDVRVLNTGHWIEGVASGGCAPSILEAHVLTHQDLVPGKVYKQVSICAHLPGGSILVQLGGRSSSSSHQISGLIPSVQLFDVVSKDSSEYRQRIFQTKYAIGSKADVRILWVDSLRKKCLVTAKKAMVQASSEQIISNYADTKVGQMAVGFVSRINDEGLCVTFCNKVYGKVSSRSLAAELGIEDHRENYTVGDVVTCRVVKSRKLHRKGSIAEETSMEVDSDDDANDVRQTGYVNRREHWELTLSLNVHKYENDEYKQEEEVDFLNPQKVRLRAGAILPTKSMKIVQLVNGKSKENGGYVPGYAIVSIKSKHLVEEESLVSNKMISNVECKLPFSQLVDSFDPVDVLSVESLDDLAKRVLTVGKKIKQKGLVLLDPRKSNVDYASGIGKMPVVSLRKLLIQTMEEQSNAQKTKSDKISIIPLPDTNLFVGVLLLGFVAQVDIRHGAFVRFLDGMTGLVPKKHGGLQLCLYDTVVTKVVVIDDTVFPHRILLDPISVQDRDSSYSRNKNQVAVKVGDKICKATVSKINFQEASLNVIDGKLKANNVCVHIHCTNKESSHFVVKYSKKHSSKHINGIKPLLTKNHPFYNMKCGQEMDNLTVVSVQGKGKHMKIFVTDKVTNKEKSKVDAPLFIQESSQLKPGMKINAVVVAHGKDNNGLFVQLGPTIKGFVSGLELSIDVNLLNDLESCIPLGAVIDCRVVKIQTKHGAKSPFILMSALACESQSIKIPKPVKGDLVVGRINRSVKSVVSPSLMLDLRGYIGRCCITELDEQDEWKNMPLGNNIGKQSTKTYDNDNDGMIQNNDENMMTAEEEPDTFVNKGYIECRVLSSNPNGNNIVDVSLRPSRINGDLDDDPIPASGDIVQGYVVQTSGKGCFLRFSRSMEGRSTLKELCDGFVSNPSASFPMGRLVIGKIKETRPTTNKRKHSQDQVTVQADVDMRESVLIDEKENMRSFEDITIGEKYKGMVQTITDYGVFVRIENSNLDGLVHLSECSDKFIKNLENLYSPGDLVKVLVLKKDNEKKRVGLSMKASHFEDDSDSDESSIDSDDVDINDDEDDDSVDTEVVREFKSDDDSDSADENYLDTISSKTDDDNDNDDSNSSSSSSEESDCEDKDEIDVLDTNVGFNWDANALGKTKTEIDKNAKESDSSDSDSDSDDDGDDDDEDFGKEESKSRKSRKRQAKKRREEQETFRRETSLADGSADNNPETAADFERLLAGEPNNSELWIRYMAFYLSLADISSARKVAEKAFDRIEFRQEKEKLNVWSALLTLEHKYGSEETFQDAIEQASKQNNPKQVYLRACEIRANYVEKSLNDATAISKADALFKVMCKKHKSKKKVWLAYMHYLLKQSRHQDAHLLMKRAMLSLATTKHAETMSKFAQMEFELGSPERGRTIFDGLLLKYHKRLDIFYVYLDKECKYGTIENVRSMLEKKVNERKLSDRQMKSLFKKWYRIEEEHGTEESREHVKESARAYVTTRH